MKIGDLPARCFQGIVPSLIATSSADGIPNISYLSSIERLPNERIALSCQFFNKTKANELANPRVCLEIYDPLTFEAFRVEARYSHEELEGPLFDRMSSRLDAIASHVGMKGVFRLRASDVLEVLSVEVRDGFLDGSELAATGLALDPGGPTEVRALQVVSGRIRGAHDLDTLLRELFASLDEVLGFRHAIALVPDETQAKLFVVATHGYPEDSVGAEIAIGEGLLGAVAHDRRVMRTSCVDADLRYHRAMRAGVERTATRRALAPEIPLPGLVDAKAQLAIPLLVSDRLVGVLAFESEDSYAFDDWHEAFLEVVGNQVAVTMENVVLRERDDDAEGDGDDRPSIELSSGSPTKRVRFYPGDDCVFVDDDYLIQNLPARVLWYVLDAHASTGRVDFTNRELRLASVIGLPKHRDNLESRLVLLRRRLAEKCPEIRIASTGRGRFRLETSAKLVLETQA